MGLIEARHNQEGLIVQFYPSGQDALILPSGSGHRAGQGHQTVSFRRCFKTKNFSSKFISPFSILNSRETLC